MNHTKEQMLLALARFVAQRPNLRFEDYGSMPAYRAAMRKVTQQRHHCDELIAAVACRSITAEDILAAAGKEGPLWGDSTGEWAMSRPGRYPLEYRGDAAQMLARVLQGYWLSHYPASALAKCAQEALSNPVCNIYFKGM